MTGCWFWVGIFPNIQICFARAIFCSSDDSFTSFFSFSSFPVIKEESVETLLTTKYNPAPFDQNSPSINMEQVYLTVEKNMLVDGKLGKVD